MAVSDQRFCSILCSTPKLSTGCEYLIISTTDGALEKERGVEQISRIQSPLWSGVEENWCGAAGVDEVELENEMKGMGQRRRQER